ncbi:MAG: ribosome maturation factor RimP [Candidatus Omnitrophota bacterium]
MDKQEIISELKDIIGEYLRVQGLDLVDLIYRYEGRGLFLRILTDRPQGGINLAECARLNNEISRILDEKDILQGRYILEVSSPGIDRPLKTKSDFERCMNRKARFFLSEPVNGKIELEGVIAKAEDDSVYIDIEGESVDIPLAKLAKAKQIVDIT